jgi:beta-lactamase superfamily II metal-dependent hydrolase
MLATRKHPKMTNYEIEFIHVGTGNRNGDAIVVRYGEAGNYKILVYDGGTLKSGEDVVAHIKQNYNTTVVDDVVNSHPDGDHASGLRVVIEELDVKRVHMHRPWEHSSKILEYFKDGRITDTSLAERLQEKMRAAYEVEQLALERNILQPEPFQGMSIGGFVVLSPPQDWYIHSLIADFEKSPEPKAEKSFAAGAMDSLTKVIETARAKIETWIDEHWDLETLHEDVETSAENESSVVLYGPYGSSKGLLLTGDAGVQALSRAADYLEGRGYSLPNNLRFVQIPHHGSRHNVSPSVLNRILGPILPHGSERKKIAFASTSTECDTHPRKVVTNAFMRRGFNCYQHRNKSWIRQVVGTMPHRSATTLVPIPFHSKVEG